MGHKLLAFGEVMMRFSTNNYMKLKQTQTLNYSFAGTGVNVLSGLSHYGHETALVTKLPNNSVGDAAISKIAALGIHTNLITRGSDYVGMYFLETGYDVRPSRVTYSNRKSSSFCTSQLSDYDFDKIFKDAKLIHFCGIALAVSENTRNLVLQVAEEAKKRDVLVAFDCNYRPKLWDYQYDTAKIYYEKMLHLADICFMTDQDAQYILQMQTDQVDKKERIADLLPRVAEKFNIELISGTIRQSTLTNKNKIEGFMCHDGEITYSKQYTFEILDRIGAGDGFASGIIHGYIEEMELHETVEFATAAGVLAHTTIGDATVSSVDEINALVSGKGVELER